MVTGVKLLSAICYTYNAQKVIYFIVIYTAGSTKWILHYSSKYPDQFSNVAIHLVTNPLVMYKLFGSVNGVDSHNK